MYTPKYTVFKFGKGIHWSGLCTLCVWNCLYHCTFPPAIYGSSSYPTFANIWCCIFLTLAILVYVKWYLNAVLMCIFLMTTDAEYTFSQVHVPFIRILLWGIYSNLLPISELSVLLLQNMSFVRGMYWEYFASPVSFHFVNSLFWALSVFFYKI